MPWLWSSDLVIVLLHRHRQVKSWAPDAAISNPNRDILEQLSAQQTLLVLNRLLYVPVEPVECTRSCRPRGPPSLIARGDHPGPRSPLGRCGRCSGGWPSERARVRTGNAQTKRRRQQLLPPSPPAATAAGVAAAACADPQRLAAQHARGWPAKSAASLQICSGVRLPDPLGQPQQRTRRNVRHQETNSAPSASGSSATHRISRAARPKRAI